MKVILDTNIWISFFFGRHFTQIADILRNDSVEIYVSDELISEIKEVALRPKFSGIISPAKLKSLLTVIDERCTKISDYSAIESEIRDSKDLYLISMAEAIPADYLVTGDKDLLILIRQGKCRIITFSEFLNLL